MGANTGLGTRSWNGGPALRPMRSSGPGVTVVEEEEGEGVGASTTHAGEEGTADPMWTSKGQSQNDIKLTAIS